MYQVKAVYMQLLQIFVSNELIPSVVYTFQIKAVLDELLSVRCPSSLTNPAGQGFFNEYETSVSFLESGTRTKEIEPFCGEKSSKNPSFLFSSYNYNTVNLNFHSKVRCCLFIYCLG